MQQSLHVLSHLKEKEFEIEKVKPDSVFYEPTYFKEQSYTLPHHTRILLDGEFSEKLVTVFNSVARNRVMLVDLHVSTYRISVSFSLIFFYNMFT